MSDVNAERHMVISLPYLRKTHFSAEPIVMEERYLSGGCMNLKCLRVCVHLVSTVNG